MHLCRGQFTGWAFDLINKSAMPAMLLYYTSLIGIILTLEEKKTSHISIIRFVTALGPFYHCK